ncbi:MAG: GreA/GreB family elongation factor, partial [Planctomycetes bacterium]|nr:GreA/GreB family elongation factor [Planctomycetota bacterium]
GTKVKVTWLDEGMTVTYRLLGPWDSADDVVNYKATLGIAMVSKHPGDEVIFDNQDNPRRYRIDSVERIV